MPSAACSTDTSSMTRPRAIVVAVIVVLVLALGYLHHRKTSGKMSAAQLGGLLYEPCTADPHKNWDYLCTESETGQVWGYDVNGGQVTRSRLLKDSSDP